MPDKPLAGRTVVVTRSAEQAGGLAGPLEDHGATVLLMPVIEIVDPDDWGPVDAAISRLAEYDWVAFSSVNAADRFLKRLCGPGCVTTGALSGAKVAVVGSGTAEYLGSIGVPVDLVPDRFRAEGLVDSLREAGVGPGTRVLVPRALKGRDVLRVGLEALGVAVDVVPVYETVPAEADPVVVGRLREGDVDAVTFTSPSTVRNFAAVLAGAGLDAAAVLGELVKASIGPVTSRALQAQGLEADVEASPSTMPALADALAARFAEGGTVLR